MISVLLATSLVMTPASSVESFAEAYRSRRADAPVESPDPGIAQAMEIAIRAIADARCVNSAQAESVLRPFKEVLRTQGEVPYDHYSNISGRVATGDGVRSVSVRMGAVSRWALFDESTGERLNLPTEFNWLFQADVLAYAIPGGWLLHCPAIVRETTRLPYRLIWLKRDGKSLSVTARFEAVWTRVHESNPVQLEGDLLTAKTLDTPRSFRVAPYVAAPARIYRWRIRAGAPVSRTEEVQHQSLRQVDTWMDRVFRAASLTQDQQMFLADWPGFPMLRNVRSENSDLLLDFGPTFRFRVGSDSVQYLGRSN